MPVCWQTQAAWIALGDLQQLGAMEGVKALQQLPVWVYVQNVAAHVLLCWLKCTLRTDAQHLNLMVTLIFYKMLTAEF